MNEYLIYIIMIRIKTAYYYYSYYSLSHKQLFHPSQNLHYYPIYIYPTYYNLPQVYIQFKTIIIQSMINWPKPQQMSYDANGFRQKLLEIFIQHYSSDTKSLNAQIEKWREILNDIPKLKSNNISSLKNKVRKGIPDCLRIKIWPLLIDKNNNGFDYKNTLEQGKFQYENIIDLDLGRTFPGNLYFKESSHCYQSLKNVLNVISVAFPKMGYCQGLNFIAATIILKVNDEEAYEIICHILENLNHKYLLTNIGLIKIQLYVLQKLIEKNQKELWKCFQKYQVQPLQFASAWFITLFCNCLPFNYNLRIIDIYLLQGQKIIYRIALQLLQYKKKAILQMRSFDEIVIYLKNNDLFKSVDVDEFFDGVFKIGLSKKQIDRYKNEFRGQQK